MTRQIKNSLCSSSFNFSAMKHTLSTFSFHALEKIKGRLWASFEKRAVGPAGENFQKIFSLPKRNFF